MSHVTTSPRLSLPVRQAGGGQARHHVTSLMQRLKIFILCFCLSLCALYFTPVCFAKEINFQASVDKNKVGVGQALELDLTFDGTQNMPALDLPATDAFQVRYFGPSTRMSIINGQASSSVSHVYTLLPVKVGNFTIGPFQFEHNGDTYKSNALSVQVVEGNPEPQDQSAGQAQQETQDLNERIFLVMQVKKNNLYLNEITPVAIKLYVNKLGVRDIQFPQLSQDGFSVGAFDQPKQYQEVVGRVNYDVIEFHTTLFGLKPGEFRLGPAHLQCNLVVQKQSRGRPPSSFDDFFNSDIFDNFFGRYENYPLKLQSADIPVTVSNLPPENRPEDFSGALGVFDFEASVSPQEVKAGDPVTLKTAVRGQGNFNTVKLPSVASGSNVKAYEPQGKQDKEAKTSEQVLIPLNTAVKEIPAIRFSFFNTETNKYETITRGPFPLTILKPEKEEELKVVESRHSGVSPPKEDKLGRDLIYIKDSPGELRKKPQPLYKNKLFLGFQLIPFLCYLSIAAWHARKKKLATDVKYARQLLAPRKAKTGIRKARRFLEEGNVPAFYDALFETLQEYLGDKFHLPSKGITISVLDEELTHRGVTGEVLVKLRDIFGECDMVRYAASQLTKENMHNSLKKMEEVIDYLQRHKL